MGQIVNSNIIRIVNNNDWKSKYFEKKGTDSPVYEIKDIKLRDFIFKFFKDNKLIINNCNLFYLNNSLHILVSYWRSFESTYLIKKKEKLKLHRINQNEIKKEKTVEKITLKLLTEIKTKKLMHDYYIKNLKNFFNIILFKEKNLKKKVWKILNSENLKKKLILGIFKIFLNKFFIKKKIQKKSIDRLLLIHKKYLSKKIIILLLNKKNLKKKISNIFLSNISWEKKFQANKNLFEREFKIFNKTTFLKFKKKKIKSKNQIIQDEKIFPQKNLIKKIILFCQKKVYNKLLNKKKLERNLNNSIFTIKKHNKRKIKQIIKLFIKKNNLKKNIFKMFFFNKNSLYKKIKKLFFNKHNLKKIYNVIPKKRIKKFKVIEKLLYNFHKIFKQKIFNLRLKLKHNKKINKLKKKWKKRILKKRKKTFIIVSRKDLKKNIDNILTNKNFKNKKIKKIITKSFNKNDLNKIYLILPYYTQSLKNLILKTLLDFNQKKIHTNFKYNSKIKKKLKQKINFILPKHINNKKLIKIIFQIFFNKNNWNKIFIFLPLFKNLLKQKTLFQFQKFKNNNSSKTTIKKKLKKKIYNEVVINYNFNSNLTKIIVNYYLNKNKNNWNKFCKTLPFFFKKIVQRRVSHAKKWYIYKKHFITKKLKKKMRSLFHHNSYKLRNLNNKNRYSLKLNLVIKNWKKKRLIETIKYFRYNENMLKKKLKKKIFKLTNSNLKSITKIIINYYFNKNKNNKNTIYKIIILLFYQKLFLSKKKIKRFWLSKNKIITKILIQIVRIFISIKKKSYTTFQKILNIKKSLNQKYWTISLFYTKHLKLVLKQIFYNKIILKKNIYKLFTDIINFKKKNLKRKFKYNTKNRLCSLYKKIIYQKTYENLKHLEQNRFSEKFFESLTAFLKNQVNLKLIIQPLNKEIKEKIKEKVGKKGMKKIIWNSFRRFTRYLFFKKEKIFKEILNILFACVHNKNSSHLLAKLISIQISKLKKKQLKYQHQLINFIKKALKLFFSFARKDRTTPLKTKGIKIRINGRFNRSPRSKERIIKLGKMFPIITLLSNTTYAESVSQTLIGTFGIKVWTFNSNINKHSSMKNIKYIKNKKKNKKYKYKKRKIIK